MRERLHNLTLDVPFVREMSYFGLVRRMFLDNARILRYHSPDYGNCNPRQSGKKRGGPP